jgi:sugar lactone lactonase YvrE
MAYDYHIMTYTPLEREDSRELSVRMKTITKLIYLAFTVVILAIGALTANGAPNDLFVSINGDGNNGGGFIYKYNLDGVQSTFAAGLSRPRGVAFDHSGNLFVITTTFDSVSGTFQSSIVKITPEGVQSTFATLSGNLFGEDVAFDSSGNLFVMAQDQNDPNQASTIYKFTPGGVQSTFGSMPGQGFGLAFDGAGNLFAADAVFPTIWKFTPDGTRSVFVIPSIDPDHGLVGLAFDRFGNLFASTESNPVEPDTILKFTPDGMQSTFAMNLTTPRGLAFDRSGNLFVSQLAPANEILKFTPDGVETVFASGIDGPEFLAFQLRPTRRLTR